MTGWGNQDLANNSPVFGAMQLKVGSGRTAQAANNTSLYTNTTQDALRNHIAVGVFAVDPAKMANGSGEGMKVTSPGWNIRRAWEGPLVGLSVANGSGFANGETITVSNGSSNATVTITANATGNLASATVTVGGLFVNTSQPAYTFNREKHLANVIPTVAGTGYTNTDIVTVSNGIVNAVGTVTTIAAGALANSSFTFANGVGLWSAATTNAQVVVTISAANGAASNGSGATLTATLANSTGGAASAPVLGGRAGRVHYECMIEMSSLTANSAVANNVLPK